MTRVRLLLLLATADGQAFAWVARTLTGLRAGDRAAAEAIRLEAMAYLTEADDVDRAAAPPALELLQGGAAGGEFHGGQRGGKRAAMDHDPFAPDGAAS